MTTKKKSQTKAQETQRCRDTCLHTQESYKNPKHKAVVYNQRFFKVRRFLPL